MTKKILILFLTCAYVAAFSQLDTARLKQNKKLMSGYWAVSGHVDYFKFWSDTSGIWATKGKLTGAPLFVIRPKGNGLFIIPITELGDYTDPIEIKDIDNKSMTFYYPDSKNKSRYPHIRF